MNDEATFVEVWCRNHRAQYGGCYHSHLWSIPHLVSVWGSVARFQRTRFVCTRCGSRCVDLDWRFHANVGGHAIWPGIETHAHLTLYRWRHMQRDMEREAQFARWRLAARGHSPAWC